jgi:Vitamin K-dependent gamma-carboxylase
MVRLRERLRKFLFPVQSDQWLTVLRVGLGLQVTAWTLSLSNDWSYLFSTTGTGLITRDLAEGLVALQSPLVPRLGLLVDLGARLGVREDTILSVIWICLLCAGCGLLFGLASRFCAVTCWFLHLSAVKSGGFISYGVDNFMTIGLFYLMLSPLPDRLSLDGWLRKGRLKTSRLTGFFRRVLQLHLSLIYFFSGLTKCLGVGWWDGSNIWRALTRPPFNVIPTEILVRWKYVLPILGISICMVEIGYPLFIWLRRTRLFWLGAVMAMHLAIGVTMGMYLFALVMMVLNLAAFGPGVFNSRQTREQHDPNDAEATVAVATRH